MAWLVTSSVESKDEQKAQDWLVCSSTLSVHPLSIGPVWLMSGLLSLVRQLTAPSINFIVMPCLHLNDVCGDKLKVNRALSGQCQPPLERVWHACDLNFLAEPWQAQAQEPTFLSWLSWCNSKASNAHLSAWKEQCHRFCMGECLFELSGAAGVNDQEWCVVL